LDAADRPLPPIVTPATVESQLFHSPIALPTYLVVVSRRRTKYDKV